MPMTREQYGDFYGSTMLPAITTACFDEFQRRPDQWPMVVKRLSTTKSLDQYTEVGGLGLARRIAEGAAITFDEMRPGKAKNFQPDKFGLAIQTTIEMAEDRGKWPIIGNMSKQLGRAIAETREVQIASMWNNGFDTAFPQYNGKPMFSTTHGLLRGGTWSNRLPAVGLSIGALETGMTLMRRTPDLSGRPARLVPKKLIVPIRNEFLAYRLLKSPDDPETANRSINSLGGAEGGTLSTFVYQYLDYGTAGPIEFMLHADEIDVVVYERTAPYMTDSTDWDTESSKTGMRYRWSFGCQNPRGVLGVPSVGSSF